MLKIYSALEIAKYIISSKINSGISNLKLQKVLYFIQAEFLVVKNNACFYENIEAWDFGPVVPDVYFKYRVYGSKCIPREQGENFNIKNEDAILIDEIIKDCEQYSTTELVNITHNQTPWILAYKQIQNNIITNNSIREFFL